MKMAYTSNTAAETNRRFEGIVSTISMMPNKKIETIVRQANNPNEFLLFFNKKFVNKINKIGIRLNKIKYEGASFMPICSSSVILLAFLI